MIKIRIRAIVGVMIFLGYFLTYVVRYNLSVHIVDMAQVLNRDDIVENDNLDIKCCVKRTGIVDIISWDDTKVGKLFSAYHIGYCICFPIFHSFGDRLGPTWVVGIAGMLSGVLCCLTPAAAYYHFWVLFLVRIIKGFCAGAMQPSMVQVLRYWVPPIERNHFMWAYCGITTGTFCTFLMCAGVHYYSRWPIGFYISGGTQIMWSLLWVLVVTDAPKKHPCISDEELAYLFNTIGNVFPIKLTNSQAPWRLILRSIPFWALCILNFGYSWMIISLCIHGPLYYTKVLRYSIYTASALTALPFLIRLILGTILIQTFHYYRNSPRVVRLTHLRKYFIFLSHVIPGLVVCISWMLPIAPGPLLLTIAVGLTAAGMDLTLDLCYELSPAFVNSINTVIKIIGNTSGIIVSLGVGQVTNKIKNVTIVWKHIWCFHALILFLSGVIFLVWGETQVQPWNHTRRDRPRRKYVVQPVLSLMSNITEVEEGSVRSSLAKVTPK
ncbi:vesicular glutamate transporter 2.2-like isoform X2 [Trichoplusia ni]|uniref:Vesicular glutamate transporter 2.2-like isoform X2 n=1 Tax=Trichoplusia ni TaxID=7111 RepID=A0A7E5VBV0_TRINI|nr:vesicular glutamate transporter 2.2-like isoform X2 [Trichoplusia ni]